jgi:lactate permease
MTQVYDPLGHPLASTLLAALPTILLLGLLASGRVSAHLAALVGLLAAVALAIFAYVPADTATADWAPVMLKACGLGAAFGLFPIGWIVFAAIFLYNLTVDSGSFEIVKRSVASLSDDRRIQALLIAFSFGAFIEGAAGFGTPVAISAALMMGAGFKPLYAAGLALLANTSPVAFGALGTPIATLSKVTGIGEMPLSQMAGRQLPLFSLVVPVWLVWVMAGFRGVLGVWPALLVSGGSFALVQFLTANYLGPALVDVLGGLASLVLLALFLRVWQPTTTWHFADETPDDARASSSSGHDSPLTPGVVLSAWLPWILLTLLVLAWGVGKSYDPTVVTVPIEGLHRVIARDQPVVAKRHLEDASFAFNWLSATGTGIFVASILSALWLRCPPGRFVRIFFHTLWAVRWPLFTIACMLALAYTTRYSGMDATLGLAFTRTGAIYPLFAALLGWLGVALTGSDTSSNALFGSLQTITAAKLVNDGVLPLSVESAQILCATANSTGGVMGKMIDAQSIVVAAVATKQDGQEGPILRFVFWHSLVLAVLMGILVLFQAYVWTSSIPMP